MCYQKLCQNTLQLEPPKAHVLALPFVNQSKVHITNEMVLWRTKPFVCHQIPWDNISKKALKKDHVLQRNVLCRVMMCVLLLVVTLLDHLGKMEKMAKTVWMESMAKMELMVWMAKTAWMEKMVWTDKMVQMVIVLKNVHQDRLDQKDLQEIVLVVRLDYLDHQEKMVKMGWTDKMVLTATVLRNAHQDHLVHQV